MLRSHGGNDQLWNAIIPSSHKHLSGERLVVLAQGRRTEGRAAAGVLHLQRASHTCSLSSRASPRLLCPANTQWRYFDSQVGNHSGETPSVQAWFSGYSLPCTCLVLVPVACTASFLIIDPCRPKLPKAEPSGGAHPVVPRPRAGAY